MKICKTCGIAMNSGTSYQNKKGERNWKRYDECKRCGTKIYNNSPNFQELLRGNVKSI